MDWSNFPNVWGPGQLLAFSGVDGPTSSDEPFVLHTGERPGELRVRLPIDRLVMFPGLNASTFECVAGDALSAGPYRAAFADGRTLAGTLPAGVALRVGDTAVAENTIVWSDASCCLLAGCSDGRWHLARRRTGEPLGPLPPAGELLAARTAYLRRVTVPDRLSDAEQRLLRKAVSVGKVNVESPTGRIRRRWTTPDRFPHRHMWLWDSAFHAIGLARHDLPLAQDAVLAMLENLEEDGRLPLCVRVDGQAPKHSHTQPPIMAWAVRTLLDFGADPAWAETCRPLLWRALEWDRTHRDRNGNGIPEWNIQSSPLCRCGESGLDNSPVHDGAVPLDAPDFGAFLAQDYACLAEIARRTGNAALAQRCAAQAEAIGGAVRARLWRADREFFFHRDFEGRWVDCLAISGFMPLFAGIASAEQAATLARHLDNPATFGAPVPVPSVSLDSGTFCKDMWRGPAWMNVSYLVYLGLRRYGFAESAGRLRARMLAAVNRWYLQTGCLWEYYDALDLTPPGELDRKQRLQRGEGIAPISDYHWTAAVTVALLLDDPVCASGHPSAIE